MIPDAATRKQAWPRARAAITAEFLQFGRWYAYGVLPLRVLGPDMGAIIVRSESAL
jgi:hypothetical protein